MTSAEFAWVYLIFFLIPLAKILPRLIKKWKTKHFDSTHPSENLFQASNNISFKPTRESVDMSYKQESYGSTDMLVLGELSRGTKNFDTIQKKLYIDPKILDMILEDLENQGLMRVDQKKGLFGLKVELYPTEEGRKKYYS
jgi:DNA-binding MarR family transcriptional regulator